MAKVRSINIVRQVTKTVVQDVVEEHVELTLTVDEAKTLSAILRRVGGSPDFIRGEADKIDAALKEAGFRYQADEPQRLTGHLSFDRIHASDLKKANF